MHPPPPPHPHTSVEPATFAAPSVIDPATLTEHGISGGEEDVDAIVALLVGRALSRDARLKRPSRPADEEPGRTARRGVASRGGSREKAQNSPVAKKLQARLAKTEKGKEALRRTEPLPAARG